MIERRRHKRYRVQERAFVHHDRNVGDIKNVSMGGLCCQCSSDPGYSPKSGEFGIVCPTDKLSLRGIPFRHVVHEVTESPKSMFLSHLCRVEFTGLARNQQDQLEQFLNSYINH